MEDPDELDTRFSKFSPSFSDSSFNEDENEDDLGFDDDLLNSYQDLDNLLDLNNNKNANSNKEESPAESLDLIEEKEDSAETAEEPAAKTTPPLTKIFSFKSLDEVIRVSAELIVSYHGHNDLYKNEATNTYYLVLTQSEYTPQEFNRICNLVSEYGKLERSTYATIAYFKEHFEVIVRDNAVQILSVM